MLTEQDRSDNGSQAFSIVIVSAIIAFGVGCVAHHWMHDKIMLTGIGLLVWMAFACMFSVVVDWKE